MLTAVASGYNGVGGDGGGGAHGGGGDWNGGSGCGTRVDGVSVVFC